MKQDNPIESNYKINVFSTPLKQERFRIKEISITTIEPIKFKQHFMDPTMGPFKEYNYSVVRITDASGFSGECEYPTNAIWILNDFFAPALLQLGEATYHCIHKKLYWIIRNEGFRGGAAMALGHIDRAFYDLAAKRQNMPVYRYLGGTKNMVKAYGSGGGINLSRSELENELLRWESEGFGTVKMKFGGFNTTLKEDIDRIANIREVLKPETALAIDANQFMKLPRALEFVKEMEHLDIAWLEEPIHSADLHEIKELCSNSKIKISYGESERSAKVFPSIIASGVDHLQPIAGHLSSIEEWIQVLQWGYNERLDMSCGGVSFLSCQFTAAAPVDILQEFLEPVIGPLEELFCVKPVLENGFFKLSDEPGIGVQVDWKRLEKENRISVKKNWK